MKSKRKKSDDDSPSKAALAAGSEDEEKQSASWNPDHNQHHEQKQQRRHFWQISRGSKNSSTRSDKSSHNHESVALKEKETSASSSGGGGNKSKSYSKRDHRSRMPDEVSIRMPSGGGTGGPPTPKPKKAPSRFSLRRLFYDNPLLAQPFLQSPLATPAPSSSNRRRGGATNTNSNSKGPTPGRSVDDQSETRSMWRDNLSACSSVHGGAASNTVKECPLCLAEVTLDHYPLLRNCPHLFCIECLTTYVRIEIQEGRVNLRCPQCPELMHPNGE